MIIEYCLVFETSITRETHANISQIVLKFALQNKHLAVLAEQIYFAKNTFVVRRGVYPSATGTSNATFSYPNPSVAHWVRKIVLRLEVSTHNTPLNIDEWSSPIPIDSSDWHYLLRGDLADWQD